MPFLPLFLFYAYLQVKKNGKYKKVFATVFAI